MLVVRIGAEVHVRMGVRNRSLETELQSTKSEAEQKAALEEQQAALQQQKAALEASMQQLAEK